MREPGTTNAVRGIGRWIFVRDGRWSLRRRLALAGLALVALILLLPLRLVLELSRDGMLRAEAVEGSVWNGRLASLFAGSLPLGTVDIALRPLPLLLGRAEVAMDRPEWPGTAPFHAIAHAGSGGVVIRQATGELPLAGAMAPLPVRAIRFSDFELVMTGGECRRASGTIGLALAGLGPLLPNETALSGEARCDEGALIVAMAGPTGMERMLLRLTGEGGWTADLVLSNLPIEVSGPLLDAGFTGRPGGIGVTASGRL